jgi:hypothetical protein
VVGPYAPAINVLIDLASGAATVVSLRYSLKQQMVKMADSRALLIVSNVFFLALIGFDLGRNFTDSTSYLTVYVMASTVLVTGVLVDLAALAFNIYVRPTEANFSGRIGELFGRRFLPHGLALLLFGVLAFAADVYVIVAKPYTLVVAPNFLGETVGQAVFNSSFLYLIVGYAFFFLLYPSIQFVLASRKERDPSVRRSLVALTASWDTIAVSLLVFVGILPYFGVYAVRVGYLVATVALVSSSLVLRRSAVLASLFEPVGERKPDTAGLGRAAPEGGSRYSGAVLFEADPSLPFEAAVTDFVSSEQSLGGLVFALTSRGSPVWKTLRSLQGVRLLVLSDVSYAKSSPTPLEVLVPRSDEGALLKVLDETVSRSPEMRKAIVLDSVSDMVMTLGFEDAYKFLKKASELFTEKNVPALMIVFTGAHDEKEINLLRSLFGTQLVFDQTGLNARKHA